MDKPIEENDSSNKTNRPQRKSDVLFRMESTASTKELMESSSIGKGIFKKMFSRYSCKILLVVVILLSIALIVMTSLYVMEHNRTFPYTAIPAKERVVECFDQAPDLLSDTMPPEIRHFLSSREKLIKERASATNIKAASFGIVYNGKLSWTYHVGHLNYSAKSSMKPNESTPYPIASLTKLITAVMLHRLIDKGLIKTIDEPVKKYQKDFRVKNPFNKEDVNFRQLLCMRSALPREAPCYPAKEFNFCPYTNTEMWKRIANVSLTMKPSTLTSYSNLGYAVLGRALESVAKSGTFEHLVTEDILKPLGMNNSGFNVRQKLQEIPLSTNADGTIARVMDWGWLNPAAGMYSTISDLHKLVNVLMSSSESNFLSLSARRQLISPEYIYANQPVLVSSGCPFSMLRQETHEKVIASKGKKKLYQPIFMMNGNTFGYYSYIILSPNFKLAALALIAYGGNPSQAMGLTQLITNDILPLLDGVSKQNKTKTQLPSNIEAFIGKYALQSYWPFVSKPAEIFVRNNKLFVRIDYFVAALVYVKPWVLKTVYVDSIDCKDVLTGSGLYNNLYHFEPPRNGSKKCSSFYIEGISATGYTSFTRT